MARRKFHDTRAAAAAARTSLFAAAADPTAGARSPDHLGDLAWWDPVFGWKRTVSDVADVFRAHGFDPDQILPASPDWASAFGRAITHVRPGLKDRDYTLLDAANGPNGERRVAIVKIDRKGQVSTADEGTVVCPKDGSKPYVERHDPSGIGAAIIAAADGYHGVYISDDVRNAVTETFERCAAMPCRARIPYIVYWMPPSGADVLARLSDAVEACGWGRIEIFSGYKTDERSARACVNAVNDGLEAKLSEFALDVEKYAGADPSRTRATTIENKLEEAKRLRAQGALYRTILGAAVESVDERISAIEDSLRKTLGLVESAHAA